MFDLEPIALTFEEGAAEIEVNCQTCSATWGTAKTAARRAGAAAIRRLCGELRKIGQSNDPAIGAILEACQAFRNSR